MKRTVFVLTLLLVASLAYAQEEAVKTGPMIKFDQKVYNFGTIIQGDTIEHTFTFKNIGTEPLKITSARGSCGCTVPSYSSEAIAPGGKGEVFVRFKSAGKRGKQNKTVTLLTNAVDRKPVVLSIRGTVELPKAKTEGDD